MSLIFMQSVERLTAQSLEGKCKIVQMLYDFPRLIYAGQKLSSYIVFENKDIAK